MVAETYRSSRPTPVVDCGGGGTVERGSAPGVRGWGMAKLGVDPDVRNVQRRIIAPRRIHQFYRKNDFKCVGRSWNYIFFVYPFESALFQVFSLWLHEYLYMIQYVIYCLCSQLLNR